MGENGGRRSEITGKRVVRRGTEKLGGGAKRRAVLIGIHAESVQKHTVQ